MIVFIALILVAAVASTIIIQTVENLQQTGEDTSGDTRELLSNKVILDSAYVTATYSTTCTAILYEHGIMGGWAATYTVGDYSGDDFLDPNNDGVNEANYLGTSIRVSAGLE